jgi:hypothetical protein
MAAVEAEYMAYRYDLVEDLFDEYGEPARLPELHEQRRRGLIEASRVLTRGIREARRCAPTVPSVRRVRARERRARRTVRSPSRGNPSREPDPDLVVGGAR